MGRVHYISPMRCLTLGVQQAAVAAQNSILALFNNSNGQFLIAIRDIMLQCSVAGLSSAGVAQGRPAGTSTNGGMVVPNQAQLPGQIFASTAAGFPSVADSFYVASTVGQTIWNHEFPFRVIPPGYYWWVASPGVNQLLTIQLLWECVYQENIAAPDDFNELELLVEQGS